MTQHDYFVVEVGKDTRKNTHNLEYIVHEGHLNGIDFIESNARKGHSVRKATDFKYRCNAQTFCFLFCLKQNNRSKFS